MEEILQEAEEALSRAKTEMPLTSYHAADSGDDLLLHQLLKRGSNPNEVDAKDGKTALVHKFYLLFLLIFANHNQSKWSC